MAYPHYSPAPPPPYVRPQRSSRGVFCGICGCLSLLSLAGIAALVLVIGGGAALIHGPKTTVDDMFAAIESQDCSAFTGALEDQAADSVDCERFKETAAEIDRRGGFDYDITHISTENTKAQVEVTTTLHDPAVSVPETDHVFDLALQDGEWKITGSKSSNNSWKMP